MILRALQNQVALDSVQIFKTVFTRSSHVIFSSIITSNHFIEDLLLIELLATFRSENFNGMLSLTDILWNKVYLVFFTCSDNMLAMTTA